MASMELASAKYFDAEVADADVGVKLDVRWTAKLTIIAFLLGFFGLWGTGSGVLQFIAIFAEHDIIAAASSESPTLQEYASAIEKFRTPRIFLVVTQIGIGFGLGLAALLMFIKTKSARQWASTICGVAIGFHVCSAVLGCLMVVSASATMEQQGRNMISQHVSGEELDSVVSTQMGNVVFVAIVATLFGLFIKSAAYVAFMLHLNTPNVRAIFGENPYPEFDEMKARHEEAKYGQLGTPTHA